MIQELIFVERGDPSEVLHQNLNMKREALRLRWHSYSVEICREESQMRSYFNNRKTLKKDLRPGRNGKSSVRL